MRMSILALSVPIFIEIFLQLSLGTVDQFMMSQYSQNAVAAVANANQIINIIIMLITVMSTATTILIAQYLGARDKSKIAEVCTVSLFSNGVFTAMAGGLIILFQSEIYVLLDIPSEIIQETSAYLTLVAAGIPLQGLYLSLAAAFRGHSWPKVTMYAALVMNVVHIVSNLVFIFGWGPIPAMGVVGVAISTNLNKALGLGILVYLFRYRLQVQTAWSYLKPFPWDTLKRLLHISVPSGGETLSYQLSQTAIMKMINIFGLAVINTKVYVSIIALCCYIYTIAISSAAQIVVGYLIGAEREQDVSKKVWQTMAIAIGISFGLSLFFYLNSERVLRFFTNDAEVIALGTRILFIDLFLEIGRAINIVMVCCLQAAGDIRTPMVVGILGMWLIAVPLSYVFGMYWGWGLIGIWLAMTFDEVVRGIVFVIRWNSGKWKNRKLI